MCQCGAGAVPRRLVWGSASGDGASDWASALRSPDAVGQSRRHLVLRMVFPRPTSSHSLQGVLEHDAAGGALQGSGDGEQEGGGDEADDCSATRV